MASGIQARDCRLIAIQIVGYMSALFTDVLLHQSRLASMPLHFVFLYELIATCLRVWNGVRF
jgi:hypothetical protein